MHRTALSSSAWSRLRVDGRSDERVCVCVLLVLLCEGYLMSVEDLFDPNAAVKLN